MLNTAPPSDRFWKILLTKIEEGRVIPVVGPELVLVNSSGRREPLETVVAHRFAERAGVPAEGDDGAVAIRDVVARPHRADPLEDHHGEVHRILKAMGSLASTESLRALARITDFNFYVTLSFGSLLCRALDEERDLTDPVPQHIGFAPNLRQVDLSVAAAQLGEPHVYALFGKACSAAEFVIGDEDMIEWVTALQDPDNRPLHLFDALRTHHILILGCALPDWLLRFLLRMTREGRVSATRPSETLIDAAIPDQSRLVAFLNYFSPNTAVLDTDPAAFAVELKRRWQERKRQSPSTPTFDVPPDLRSGGVFLSYASADVDAAPRLHVSLAGCHIDTWFNSNGLRSGASYDRIIEPNIGRRGLFVLIASKATQHRLERWPNAEGRARDKKPYFLIEWELALARERLFEGRLAMWPIALGAPDPKSPMFPEALPRRTSESLPEGDDAEAFVRRAKASVRELRKRNAGDS